MSRVQRVNTVLPNDGGASQEVCLLKLTCGIIIWNVQIFNSLCILKNTKGLEIFSHQLYIGIPQENIFFCNFWLFCKFIYYFCGRVSLRLAFYYC